MELTVTDADKYSYLYKSGFDDANEIAVQAVMDLFFALREIKGEPKLIDLIRLAKRIKSGSL
jgi:hypothetical protein